MATTTTIGSQFSASTTRPMTRPLTDRLEEVVESWARTQYELVTLAAEFADSPEWVLTGSPTPAHWLAIIADVEACTTREWIRIGRKLVQLPAIADAFKTRAISYSKVRTLTRAATSDNEHELLHIALVRDAQGNPIDAANRRRHPNRRQKRLVKERDETCIDCERQELLQYDHVPAYEDTGRTITTELELRCAPCHHNRHTQNG